MPAKPFVRSLLLFVVAIIIFLLPQPFLTADQQVELWSGGLTVACLWGIWRWGATAWRAAKEGSSAPWHYGILAIVILLMFLIARQSYQVINIRFGRPEEWTRLPISAFIIYGTMIAVWLFSIATRLDGEKPSKLMGWITAIGAALAIFLSSLWPILVSKGSAIIKVFHSVF